MRSVSLIAAWLGWVLMTAAPAFADEGAAGRLAPPAATAPTVPALAPVVVPVDVPAAVDLQLVPPRPASSPSTNAVTIATAPAGPAKPRRYLYKSWLFWTVVGGLVAGTVVITYAVSRPAPAPYYGNVNPGVFIFP